MRQAAQKEVHVPALLLVVLVTCSPSHSHVMLSWWPFTSAVGVKGEVGAGLKAEFQKQVRCWKEMFPGSREQRATLFSLVITV